MTEPTREILYADGRREPLPDDAVGNMAAIERLIGADGVDIVPLRRKGIEGWIMIADDNGMSDGRPENRAATSIYHTHYPTAIFPIAGDVVICRNDDFQF